MRRLVDISLYRHELLASGKVETVDWTEWMATDMCKLATNLAGQVPWTPLKRALLRAAKEAEGRGILDRLAIFGHALGEILVDLTDPSFELIRSHRSDIVRQWAVYAVNDAARPALLADRLAATLPFAADHHMSVRECAWMAFRPGLTADLPTGLKLLEPVSRSESANERRFAIEVTRPRSVWGRHIGVLKKFPEKGLPLLRNVHRDSSRYVRLSAGNWLNDASKTRPDWVQKICTLWSQIEDKNTQAIVKRALRTIVRPSKPDCE
jgi:3-methyladenine DNA glycosylase AlkC